MKQKPKTIPSDMDANVQETWAAYEIVPTYQAKKATKLPLHISGSSDAARMLLEILNARPDAPYREVFMALYLSRSHQVVGWELISTGTESACIVPIKFIVRSAVLLGAPVVIIAHNHPSGNAKPSAADIAMTQKVRAALVLLDSDLADHIIMLFGQDGYSASNYTSLADEGTI